MQETPRLFETVNPETGKKGKVEFGDAFVAVQIEGQPPEVMSAEAFGVATGVLEFWKAETVKRKEEAQKAAVIPS